MADTETTDTHSPAPLTIDQPGNVHAHFPPQAIPNETDEPWWNPDTNEWAPSSQQHSTFGIAEPSHADEPVARPMSEAPGQPPGSEGSEPEARLNLLDSVRQGGRAEHAPVPVQRVEHVVTTEEHAADQIRTRTVRVTGTQPTTLLEQNPNRIRARLKVITTSGQVILSPLHQGGIGVGPVAAATAPLAGWVQSQTDPVLTVEAADGVEAIASNTGVTAFTDVSIWEEMKAAGNSPGLSG